MIWKRELFESMIAWLHSGRYEDQQVALRMHRYLLGSHSRVGCPVCQIQVGPTGHPIGCSCDSSPTWIEKIGHARECEFRVRPLDIPLGMCERKNIHTAHQHVAWGNRYWCPGWVNSIRFVAS